MRQLYKNLYELKGYAGKKNPAEAGLFSMPPSDSAGATATSMLDSGCDDAQDYG